VLPKQRGREAQTIVVDHLAFSAELADYRPDVQRIPSNDSVVQDRQTTERVDLIVVPFLCARFQIRARRIPNCDELSLQKWQL
jgi:hypothetical protein